MHPAIVFTPSLIMNGIALWWLLSLERAGCSCGADWRRQYLKVWYAIAIAAPLVLMLIRDGKYLVPFGVFISAAGLLAFFALVSFLWDIERRPCECAQDWREKLILLTTVLGIAGGVAGVMMVRRQ